MSNIYAPPQSSIRQNPSSDEITNVMVAHLRTARPWAKFLGIIYFVILGIMALSLLVTIKPFFSLGSGIGFSFLAIFLIIFAIFFVMARHLMAYNRAIANLVESNDIQDIEEAQVQFGKFCRFFAILIITAFVSTFLVLLLLRGIYVGGGYQ